MRYLIMQIASGMLLFFGALVQLNATGALAFGYIGLDAPGWMADFHCLRHQVRLRSYIRGCRMRIRKRPEVGTVFTSAFTAKLAVYALARGFAGTELLIPIGVAMAVFPINLCRDRK